MHNALIKSGESLSTPVDLGAATSITFQVSADGVTWQNLYTDAGTEVAATVAASRNVSLAAIAASLDPWRDSYER